MEPLERAVRAELERLGPAGGGDLGPVLAAWPAAVGEVVARNAWPARRARDGTLVVHTASATWAFELGRMAAEVLERLRAVAGAGAPRGLRFVPGPVPEPQPQPQPESSARTPAVSAEDRLAADRLATAVEDEELRALVARAAAASLAKARSTPGSDRCF